MIEHQDELLQLRARVAELAAALRKLETRAIVLDTFGGYRCVLCGGMSSQGFRPTHEITCVLAKAPPR